jgi:hypothetical protein
MSHFLGAMSLILLGGELRRAADQRRMSMTEYLQVWRANVGEVRVWIEPVAQQLDEMVAIGDLYRFDRFAAPASLWDDLQQRYPELLTAG